MKTASSFVMMLLLTAGTVLAQVKKDPIQASDLKRDLYRMADDYSRGRKASTLDELKPPYGWAAKGAKANGFAVANAATSAAGTWFSAGAVSYPLPVIFFLCFLPQSIIANIIGPKVLQ